MLVQRMRNACVRALARVLLTRSRMPCCRSVVRMEEEAKPEAAAAPEFAPTLMEEKPAEEKGMMEDFDITQCALPATTHAR